MDEKKLRDLTRNYWDQIDHKQPKTHLKNYVAELLPAEMDWAETHPLEDGKTRLHKPDPSDNLLLVMLVGFSIEPLLQTVYAYNPSRVLLLLNEQYGSLEDGGGVGGINWGRMVKELIKEVKRDVKIEFKVIKEPEPKSIFDTFREQIGEEAENVVIDITGGKKNMMAGAFLYAAYANIKVSYVDFDDEAYDPEERRPYGYRCRIGLLQNPYQTFALRNWEQVRALYNRYNFRAARELLVGPDGNGGAGTILEAAREYLPDQIEPIQKLVKMLRCYEFWDNAEFQEAKTIADDIENHGCNFEFPTAIKMLGGQWYRIFDNTPKFRAYVYDEFKRIERLHKNENYRSTFLRAGGLNEMIMVARLVRLVIGQEKNNLLDALDNDENETPGINSIFSALCKSMGTDIKITSSRRPENSRGGPFYVTFRGAPEISLSLPSKMTSWWQETNYFKDETDKVGWKKFLNKRNNIAHTYDTVESEMAKDALNFVQANFEDFLGNKPMDSLGFSAEVLPWSKLCDSAHIGLSLYLPPSLRSDE